MIELTEKQLQEVATAVATPPVVLDPATRIAYVLVRKDIYERLISAAYADSPWTDEERDLLAAEVDAMLDDDMAIGDAAS